MKAILMIPVLLVALGSTPAGADARLAKCFAGLDAKGRLDARRFAAALGDAVLVGKGGKRYRIEAQTDGGEIRLKIRDGKGNVVAKAWRDILPDRIGEGTTLLIEANSREEAQKKLAREVHAGLVAKSPALKNWRVSVRIDSEARKVLGVKLEGPGGKMSVTYSDAGKGLQPDGPLPPECKNITSPAFSRLVDLSLRSPEVQGELDVLERPGIRGTANAGIATALFAKYAELVPEGTELDLRVHNRETQETLRAVEDAARASGAPERSLHATTLAAVKLTLWGRVLAKAGWEVTSLSGGAPDYEYVLVARKRHSAP